MNVGLFIVFLIYGKNNLRMERYFVNPTSCLGYSSNAQGRAASRARLQESCSQPQLMQPNK